jgi:hypothetical protein
MRVHAVIDDDLFGAAEEAFPQASSKTALLEEELRALVERAAAGDLARRVRVRRFELGEVPRRRGDDAP